MRPADLRKLPMPAADHQFSYGDDPNQIGELRLPPRPGPHPVVVLVHGGCFQPGGARYPAAMGDTLKSDGIASWNIEYRRLGQPGGGWPGARISTSGRAIDYLRGLAAPHKLDPNRVVVLGHPAGGHLTHVGGNTAANRPEGVHCSSRSRCHSRVINLAGPIDVTANIEHYEETCRGPVVTRMLGGPPGSGS